MQQLDGIQRSGALLAAMVLAPVLAAGATRPVRAQDGSATTPAERSLVLFYSPDAVAADEIVARAREVGDTLGLAVVIHDVATRDGFLQLLRYERERDFPSWGPSAVVAGTHIAVGYKAILALLDGLAAGRFSLNDPLPPDAPTPQVAIGQKYGSLMRLPPPVEQAAAPPAAAFPPYGSWTLLVGILAVGLLLGALLSSWKRGVRGA